jgi:putative FmdB family regulatory protein
VPLYEYLCDACGHRFEQIRKFSDPPLEVCPKCGEHKIQKLFSSPAIQFKGAGWYVTDYAKKSSAGSDSAEAKDTKDAKDAKETKDKKDGGEKKETKDATKDAAKDSGTKSPSSDSSSTTSGSTPSTSSASTDTKK